MDEAREIAEYELGEIESVEEVHGGLMSHTFRVQTSGKDYILQINSETDPHELENCLRSFSFLSGGIPVPEPVTDGVETHGDLHYTIVTELSGDTLQPDEELTRESGRLLAQIHESRVFEEPGWIDWEDGEPEVVGFPDDSLRRRIQEVLKDWRQFFVSLDAGWLVDATDTALENLDTVPEDFTPVLVHHDFNPGNILVEDGEITGILDFDYTHSSHSVRDIAKASNKFWIRGGDRETFYSGYSEIREPERFEETIDFYLLETFLDELGGMMDLDHLSLDEAEEYRDEVERLAENIG